MERNAHTPPFARHYRPAPPAVWLRTLILVAAAVATAALFAIVR